MPGVVLVSLLLTLNKNVKNVNVILRLTIKRTTLFETQSFMLPFVIIFSRNKKYHPLKSTDNLKLVQKACLLTGNPLKP